VPVLYLIQVTLTLPLIHVLGDQQHEDSKIAAAAALTALATPIFAQSGVTIYGSFDQYYNHLSSSSGAKVNSLEDGSFLRSRLGFRGVEDLGGGYAAKFQLEMGIAGNSGAAADATRGFDRQTWVGMATPYGEFRAGRQNTIIFFRGDYVDFTSRTLGSVVNAFGVPSRYDNDLSYQSPRLGGFQFDAHYALGTPADINNQAISQLGVDYLNGPVRVGYANLVAKAPKTATVAQDVKYDNFYANYDYGQGKIYAVYIKTNNTTASGGLNNGGTIVSNVGGLVAGTNAEANNFYQITQLSADYKVTGALRVGALAGQIKDTSGGGKNAKGFDLGAYYDLSKRTMLSAHVHQLANDPNAGFRPSGSAGLKGTFTSAADVNGQTIKGFYAGIVHRF